MRLGSFGEVEAAQALLRSGGKVSCRDNVFVERLWRSVKYEEVYLTPDQAEQSNTG